MANELVEKILDYLANHEEANSLDLADAFNQDHQKIIGAIKSLESIGDMITVEQTSRKKWELTAEGQHVVEHGSHEAAVYNAIPENGITQADIMKSVPYAKIGFSKALAAGWIKIDKSKNSVMVRKAVPSIVDSIQNHLKDFSNIPDNAKGDYKKRKLLQEIIVKSVNIRKGSNFSTKIVKQEADLTADLLVNGAWKEKKFKPYNFDALGSALEVGHLHPLLKVRSEFRKIFLEMGFIEMATNNYVESSFWNFDALYQPQQHPARDAHDTFFISEPRTSSNFPEEYLEKVKQVHSKGGYGSQGYGCDWKIEEAQKNLLRTHTTAVSARMLYKLIQQGEFKPVRYFSIDRVFRNETLDATHLAEFHQVEGVVADYNLTLGDLIGTLYEFFKKLGITQLEFKPAYNPYTEPSMEIFCFHNGLGKWIEIGNSGLFRPEMLRPMGFPENVNVLAWGLSLERPTMIKYGINNIRDLVGPKVDLQMVHDNPLCRLQKTTRKVPVSKDMVESLKKRWDNILEELQNIQMDLNKTTQELNDHPKIIVKQNLTIFCDPQWPIRSLKTLLGFLKRCLKVNLSIHVHSSVEQFPPTLANFCSEYTKPNGNADVSIVLIWKSVGIDPIMKLPRMHEIVGEVNIARYMNRLIELTNSNLLKYESNGPLYANQIDSSLETIHQLLRVKNKSKLKAIFKRTKTRYALGNEFSVVDIVLDSVQQCCS